MSPIDAAATEALASEFAASELRGLWIVFHDYSARACAKWVPKDEVPAALRGGGVFARANLNFTIDDHQVAAPRFAAGQFGVPVRDADALAFVRATGGRDVLLGALILAALGERAALRRTLAWSSLAGLIDAGIVFARRGPRFAHVFHLGGFAALALAALALREPAPPRDGE